MSIASYWPYWGACSDPPEESCSDAGCPVHGVDDVQRDDDARRRSEQGDAWDGETHQGNL